MLKRKKNFHPVNLSRYAGKWVVLKDGRVIAASGDLRNLKHHIARKITDKTPLEKLPAAFKVPRKDEGPYVLIYGISLSKK